MNHTSVLAELGIAELEAGACWGKWVETSGREVVSINPTTEQPLGLVKAARRPTCQLVLAKALEAHLAWRTRPSPARTDLVRLLAGKLREKKSALAELIAHEVGKPRAEAQAEVQSMIDICDFAAGQGRQLYGLSMNSQRPRHRLFEQYQPLGVVAVITAFNFPMAVWAWNACLAAVCGDTVIWKPSEHAPLCSLAVQQLCNEVMQQADALGVFNLIIGGADVGEWLADNKRIPLVSFTGSTTVGRTVAARVAVRLGRSILELGGNNAVIVLPDADIELATRAITSGVIGTAGQRCTATRRVFAHTKVADELLAALREAHQQVVVGDPLDEGVQLGPLVSGRAVEAYRAALEMVTQQGGEILSGGRVVDRPGFFVEPTVVRAPGQASFPIAWEETFAPIVYVFESTDLAQAIAEQNAVSHGLSSSLFTDSLSAAEQFLCAAGSDCGIANVNTATSGVEVGAAFGGEKDSGEGREIGSDAWKAYMRRQTCTVNWSGELP